MYIEYTPTRQLVGGSGSDGKIDIGIEQEDERPIEHSKESRSLSGVSERVLHRIDYEYALRTVATNDSTLIAKFKELHASVAAGETFTIDLYGTEASPVDPITVLMIPQTYSKTRQGFTQYFSYSFRVRTV